MRKNDEMLVICGDSIEDLENGLEALKMSQGLAVCGVGGTSIRQIEKSLAMGEMILDNLLG